MNLIQVINRVIHPDRKRSIALLKLRRKTAHKKTHSRLV